MPELADLSDQQRSVVDLPFAPIAVTACAGSGKTKTAVHRLAAMRTMSTDRHGLIALLSFSNVAVDTFQREYGSLVGRSANATSPNGVEIDTLDGFFIKNVLRPHGYLVMRCKRTPFLIEGREPFLKSFTVFDGERSLSTAALSIKLEKDKFVFEAGKWAKKKLPSGACVAGLNKLGAVGAYTHDAGRYWVFKVLKNHPFVLRAFVRRYPHILVDEAQDIETVHEAILNLMIGAGSQVSLIGDANQGIYEFSGATGEFLSGYGLRNGVTGRSLERNYRSVPTIVKVANRLCGRNDEPDRKTPATFSGAYFVPVDEDDREGILTRFADLLKQAEIPSKNGVVICRSSKLADAWMGADEPQGKGIIKSFATAAILRDKLKQFDQAFGHACAGVVGLLASDHHDLLGKIKQGIRPEIKGLRRAVWHFTKDQARGLPSATLIASTEWHPELAIRVKTLVADMEKEFGLKPADNLGRRLARTDLVDKPLMQLPDEGRADVPSFRVSTVHKVKGESLDGVLYVARKADIEALLNGPSTEVGRIGYVAVTRARNLFVLGVPKKNLMDLKDKLEAAGFEELPALGGTK